MFWWIMANFAAIIIFIVTLFYQVQKRIYQYPRLAKYHYHQHLD